MRYLTLSADYLNPSLRDQSEGRVAIDRAGLPPELVARIVAWNDEYQVVVQLDLSERRAINSRIEELDESGAALAAEIERALAPSKVSYYSEGLLRML